MTGWGIEMAFRYRASRNAFEDAVHLYRSQAFAEAQPLFARIVLENPEDKAAESLLSRCEHDARHGAPLGWDRAERSRADV